MNEEIFVSLMGGIGKYKIEFLITPFYWTFFLYRESGLIQLDIGPFTLVVNF